MNFHAGPKALLGRRAVASLLAAGLLASASAALADPARAAGNTPSATTLTSSRNPANHDDPIIFDVVVTDQSDACQTQGNCVSPTGDVMLEGIGSGGGVLRWTHATSPGVSVASYETVRGDLNPGQRTITAVFQGDATFAGSQGSVVQTVNSIASTSTSLMQDYASSIPGQSVKFTATVTPGDYGSPQGQVQFYEGGNPYGGPVWVTYDTYTNTSYAEITTTGLSGVQTFVARYLADSSYDTSVSNQVTHSVVNPSVTVTLFSEANPSVAGQSPVWLHVDVQSNNPGAPTPTGTVTVYQDGNAVEQGTVSNGGSLGLYMVDISYDIGLGDNYMTANYYGDSTYPAASSGTLDQVVNQDATTTTLSSSANPSAAGQPVTFTSTTSVTAPGPFSPTGNVTFYDNSTSTLLGTAPLGTGGQATFTTTALAAGTHSIQAVYSGDTYCSTDNSNTVNQSVTNGPPPTVSAVAPRAGATAGGTSITITGTNFTAPATVRLSGTAATNVVVVSATQITATTPAHAAGTVQVQVTTGGGSSALSSADYYAYGAPTVTGLSTHSGRSAGGTVLTVSGRGFVAGDTVSFGGVAGTSVTVLTAYQLRVTVPAGTAGSTVDVTVTNPAGTSSTSAADAYRYT